MIFSTFSVLALLSSIAVAQVNLSGLPTCAQSCVTGSFGGCSQLDVKCICSNTNLISQLSCCVSQVCSAADQAATIQFAQQLCSIQGITLPSAAGCTNGATYSGSATATASSGASSASGTMSMTSGTSATSAASGTTSRASSGTSSASAAAATTGAAGHNYGSGLGLGVALAGLVAAL